MNYTIAKIGAIIDDIVVIGFAICMLVGYDFEGYLVSMFIAFGFIMMVAGFYAECEKEHKVVANTALIFTGIYAVLILLVYFTQITSVRLGLLSQVLFI